MTDVAVALEEEFTDQDSHRSKPVQVRDNWLQRTELIPILAILVLNWVLYNYYAKSLKFSGAGYFREFFAYEVYINWFRYTFVVPVAVILFGNFKKLSWSNLDGGKYIRVIVGTAVMVLAWKFSAYDFNMYVGQPHYLERFLVLSLGLLTLVNPTFCVPFLFCLVFTARQVEAGLGLYSWTDKLTPVGMIVLFQAYLLLNCCRKLSCSTFLFLALSFVGSHMFLPGVSKLTVGPEWHSWILENRLDNLIVSSYLNGWWYFLEESSVLAIANFVSKINIPFLAFAAGIELVAIVILVHRKFSMVALAGFIMLHAGIATSAGVCFWKWAVLDAAIIYVLWKLDKGTIKKLYTPSNLVLSALLIFYSPKFFSNLELGWLDSRVNQLYEFEAVGESGAEYRLGRNFFSPFDLDFAQNRFYFIDTNPIVAKTGGSVYSYKVFKGYQDNPFETLAQRQQAKPRKLNERRVAHFDKFIRNYFQNLNARGSKSFWLSDYFGAPNHIMVRGHGNLYKGQEKVKAVKVRLLHSVYDGEKIHFPKNEIIREIEIPQT